MRENTSSEQDLFEQQMLVHREMLHRFAMRLTRDAADAAALVHETYVKANDHRDKYDQGTFVNVWLCRILKNCFINAYRMKLEGDEAVRVSAAGGSSEAA